MTTYVVIMCHKVRLWSRVEGKWTNRSYDDIWRHKDTSLTGYLTIRIWDLVVENRLGTKKFRFLTDPPEINDRLGTSDTWIIRVKPENVGITKIFDSTGAVISSEKFSNFLLAKTLCRKMVYLSQFLTHRLDLRLVLDAPHSFGLNSPKTSRSLAL